MAKGFDQRFAIFKSLPDNVGEENRCMIDYRSVSQIKNGNIIDINIPAMSSHYTDLSQSRLYVKLRIIDVETGLPIIKPDTVGLQNYSLCTIWKQIDLLLNNTPVNNQTNICQPYKCIMDALLYKTPAEHLSKMFTSLFVFDSPFHMDAVDGLNGQNRGLTRRSEMTEAGKVLEMEGPLNIDVMSIDKLILSGVNMQFRLYPARTGFCLLSPDNKEYMIELLDVKLRMQHVLPNSQLSNSIESMLVKRAATYYYNMSIMRSFTIPMGIYSWEIESLFPSHQIPDTLVIGMVDSESFQGSMKLNAFNFQHFNINLLALYLESSPVNATAFQPNFTELEEKYTQEYLSLYTGGESVRDSLAITYEGYRAGYTLFKFNIGQEMKKNQYITPTKKAQNRLSLRFAAPLPKPITVICYAQVAHAMTINSEREVDV